MKYILSLIILIINVPVYAATYHPADTNKDWQISQAEFQAYNTAWKHSQDWPDPPNPIPGLYAARAGYLYKKGNCYHVGNADAPMKWMSDMDCDGSVDIEDQCPEDPNKIIPGICGCGVVESETDIDSDNDNTPDCADGCPNDPNKNAPGFCGCGELDKQGCLFTNSMGMSFVYIEPGTFLMGSPPDEPGRSNDEKQHQVALTKGFFMQTTEVTNGQWDRLMNNKNEAHRENFPALCGSWEHAQNFITTLNNKENERTYRLPTEAEWEYACRSGGKNELYCGGDNLDNLGWYYENNSNNNTHPVGSKQANGLGIFDMSGNVWEWCGDRYGEYPSYSVTDPVGPSSGWGRVIRGGSIYRGSNQCRSASRYLEDGPDEPFFILGLRLVCTPRSVIKK